MVGRGREAAAIDAALAGGPAGGVVVTGPSGVGRTRLAGEARRRAMARGRSCQWATATHASAEIPFGALAHLMPAGLSAAAAHRPVDVLRQADVVAAAWNRSDAAGGDRVDRPVVVVDDAHLLDAPSASLLHHLVLRELAVVVATVCDGERIPDSVTALWKDGVAERIDLEPLGLAELAELLEAALDGHLDVISLDRVWRTTGGRPLYVREVVTACLDDGSLARRHDMWRWDGPFRPTGRLTDLMEARLDAAGPRCRSLAELVACGEPMPVQLIERLVGRPGLERAERAGLVATGPSAATGKLSEVRLVPPIFGEVLRAVIPRARARACCDRLADAQLREGIGHPDDLLRVAAWQLEAGTPPGRRAVSFTTAARRALHQAEPDLAERLARAALDDDSPQTTAVLAEALEKQGRHAEVVELLPLRSDNAESTALALARATNVYWGTELAADWRAMLRSAATSDDDASRSEVSATEAWLLFFDSELLDCADAVRDVLARPDASDRAVVWAATAGGPALGLMGRSEEALAVVNRGQAATATLGATHPWGEAEIAWARVLALLTAGRLAEARNVVDAGHRLATHGPPQMVGMWAGFRGLVAKLEGDLATASLSLREAVTISDGADVYLFVQLWLAELAGAVAATGDVTAARQALGEARERSTGSTNRVFEPWIALDAAWVEAADGHLSLAARMAGDAADLAHELHQLAFEVLAAFDVARLGRPELVTARLATLSLEVDGAMASLCARAAQALARRDGPALLDAALGFEQLGACLLAAEAAAAATLGSRPQQLGPYLVGVFEGSRRLRELCPDAATPLLRTATNEDRLTRREREIAGLAATGRTSPEIASMLRISTRTVDNHLGRAYGKLGVTGRSGLADIFGT